MATIKKSGNIKYWWRCGAKRNHYAVLVGVQSVAFTMEISAEIVQKSGNRTTNNSAIPPQEIYSVFYYKYTCSSMFILTFTCDCQLVTYGILFYQIVPTETP